MDNLIKELVQVDKQARQRVAKAKKQRAVALEQLERDKADVRAENEASLASFVEQQKLEKETERAAALEALERQNALVIKQLDARYAQNREQWVRSVVDAVTK